MGISIPFYYYLIAICIFELVFFISRKIPAGILLSYMFLVAAETVLIRRPEAAAHYKLTPLWVLTVSAKSRRDVMNQMAANVAMFIPLGFLSAMMKRRLAVVACMAFSILIEYTQYVTHRGLCETDDVISNTIGAVIGLAAYVFVDDFLENRKKS